ncbi:phenylacetate-CoA oxygenase subunit PaaI, partial [Arthrobacter deserti]|nr:phenylacetate-CoA oxygenase subunit PaaI [Arthrobacter deserti]
HRDHAIQWTLRLGDGTEESHRRMQAGLDSVWPYVNELFGDDELTGRLAGVAARPSELRAPFDTLIAQVLEEATLKVPDVQPAMTGNRGTRHSEHLGYILAEMQVIAREHPGAT